jgi:hypothetical protein
MTFESLNVKVDPDTVMIGVVPSPPAVADLKTRYSVMPVPMLDGALQFNWIWPALANAVRPTGALGAAATGAIPFASFELVPVPMELTAATS